MGYLSDVRIRYCLIFFYLAVREELAPVHPVPKFFCVKAVRGGPAWRGRCGGRSRRLLLSRSPLVSYFSLFSPSLSLFSPSLSPPLSLLFSSLCLAVTHTHTLTLSSVSVLVGATPRVDTRTGGVLHVLAGLHAGDSRQIQHHTRTDRLG